ncbi:MAG: sulfur carrier protein ThiS [Gammaproteobacteria bacterium]|nr:sulfur carrier protein ThiS [Gammaproteobacteria bacterium]NBT45557.1 sulfur carrier protein ThiS [Gammaproteobacteria bacterium]
MEITINQTPFKLPQGASIVEAIEAFGAEPPYAIALNLTFVHRQRYSETILTQGDALEIVQPVAGG